MSRTADGTDHGAYRIEDCFEAVIERYEDGYIMCPILCSGGACIQGSTSLACSTTIGSHSMSLVPLQNLN